MQAEHRCSVGVDFALPSRVEFRFAPRPGSNGKLPLDELWRYLLSEAREFHSAGSEEMGKKQQAATPPSSSQTSPGGFVPEGAGSPAAKDTAKRQDDKAKGSGKGKHKSKDQKKPKG